MMLSKVEGCGRRSEDSSSGRLLHDIEEISKALYLPKNPRKYLIPPSDYHPEPNNYVNDEEDPSLQKGKKPSSIWSWKPLKALTHIRSRRFSCSFFLRVHTIENLPSNFNGLNLYVHWKRKDQVLQTCSARVKEGLAEFEETLMHRCSIYRNGGGSSRKYEPKLFLLYASVVGASALDIGKHWLDVTRLIPNNFEEENKRSLGKWTTSFNLTGKAEGAILNVSFGFSSSSFVEVPDIILLKGNDDVSSHFKTRSLDIDMQVVNDEFPERGLEITRSITLLYNNFLEEDHSGHFEKGKEVCDFYSEHSGPHKSEAGLDSGSISNKNESTDAETFTVIEQGIEYPSIETIDVAEIVEDDDEEEQESNSKVDRENYLCGQAQEPTIEVVEWVEESSSVDDEKGLLEEEGNFVKNELNKRGKMKRSISFDDFTTESVTNEFLNLLSLEQSQFSDMGCSDSELDSPRERLLREFEKDAIASRNPLYYFDDDDDNDDNVDDAAVADDDGVRLPLISRRDVKLLENLETEALMQQWGLNETAFQDCSSGGFGSPIYTFPPEEPLKKDDDSVVSIKTKGGGWIFWFMNPLLFTTAGNSDRLIIQVSRAIVLPAVMGSNVMEILQCWGLIGMAKMFKQVNQLMPLDDISGKTMEQVSSESKELQRHLLPNNICENPSSSKRELNEGTSSESWDHSGCVFLQDLVPSAMDKITALSIEGLRIQLGLVDEEAPSKITLMSSSSTTKNSNIDFRSQEFVDIEELVNLSVLLDDWMKQGVDIKSSEVSVNDDLKVSKILATHLRREDKMENSFDRILGDELTIAVNVQLKDPFQDYESVGNAMLALIQVERVSVPQEFDTYNVGGDKEECIPRFKITQVHIAGFNDRRRQYHQQHQFGLRWMQSSDLGMIRNNPVMTDEDTLWSLSCDVHHEGDQWNELSMFDLHSRNPDIVFVDQTINVSD